MKRLVLCLGSLAVLGCASAPKPSEESRMPTSANDTLLTCTTTDQSVFPFLYSDSDLTFVQQKAQSVRLTIGQDQSTSAPLYEVRFDPIDANGAGLNRPRTIRRIAYVEDPDTHAISLTYSPNRSTGRQETRPFNLYVDQSQTGKLSFLQVGSRNAPTEMTSFQCARTGLQSRLPSRVDLAKMDDTQAIATLRAYATALPGGYSYAYSNRTLTRPTGLTPELERAVQDRIRQTKIDEAAFKKDHYIQNKSTVAFVEAASWCDSLNYTSIRSIRDYSGQIIGYSLDVRCVNPAVNVSDEGKKRSFAAGLENFFAIGSRLIATDRTNVDFGIIASE